MRYRFGEFELDRARGDLLRGGDSVSLQPKPRRLLAHLLENRHRVVPPAELAEVLWPDEHVAATSLRTCLGRLRRALGADAKQWIETRSKEGLRWVGPCEELSRSPAPTDLDDDGGRPLVGRDREREILSAGLTSAIGGRGGLIVVRGEQGVGKTALVENLIDLARRASVVGAVGQCEEEATPPFSPWVDVLRGVRAAVGSSAWSDLSEDCGAELAILLDGEPPHRDDSAEHDSDRSRLQFRLADATARAIERAAGYSPSVVLLEDAQWADESSMVALKRLARGIQRTPALVLVTCRSLSSQSETSVEREIAELATKHGGRLIEIGRLSAADSLVLAQRLSHGNLAEKDAEEIHADSGGIPLLIEQLVEHRRPAPATDTDHAAETDAASADLPLGAKVVVEGRLGRLSERCRQVLELASVLGIRFDIGSLSRLWSLEREGSTEGLEEAIDEATRAGVFEAGGQRRLRFHHGLLRKVVYRTIAIDRLSRLHWLAGQIGADASERMAPATVAEHLVKGVAAGSPEQALQACADAAREAAARGAFAASAALWRQALDMHALRPAPAAVEEANLRIRLATALDRAGQTSEAERNALQALEIGKRSNDPSMQARALLSCAPRVVPDGTVDQDLVDRINATLEELGPNDSPWRVRLLGRLVWAQHHERDGGGIRGAASEAAIAMARRLDDPATLAIALEDRRLALHSPKNQDEHDRVLLEIIALASERGDTEAVLHATAMTAWSHARRGHLDRAERGFAECRSILEHVRSPDTAIHIFLWDMMRALLVGEWVEARRVTTELVELAAAVDERMGKTFALNHAWYDFLRGERAAELAAAALAFFPARLELRVLLIIGLLDEGRDEEAREEWQRAAAMGAERAPDDGRWLAHMANLARIAAALEERELAEKIYRRLLPLAEWNVILGPIYTAAPFGAVARLLGLLAASLERWDEAELHFQTAQRLHRSWGARPWLATTLHDHARMRMRRNRNQDRRDAQEMVDEARALATELEMKALAGRIRLLTKR